MGEPVRIQKLLSSWGIASRRAVEKMIDDGLVKVDGKTLFAQGTLIDPDNPPLITIDGKPVAKPVSNDYSIYVFNKPEWVVSTMSDELGRKSVADFMPPGKRLYPVGRLDADSTGILLITDYGELTNRLLHPSWKVEKEYVVKIAGGALDVSESERFCAGLELEDGMTSPCELVRLREPQTYSVVIREGKKRQVRRMFEVLGRKVVSLHRIRFGPLKLGTLKPGELRLLTPQEKAALLKAAGLPVD